MKRALILASCAAAFLAACNRSAPANVAAMVNGRAITYAELDMSYQSQFPSAEDRPSDDQVLIQRLEVLRSLVDGQIMLQRAEKLGLMAADSDVEAKFTELKAPYTQEEFQKQLTARKMTAEDLKTQLRRELSVQKLFNKEITSQISIGDKDITDFYNANKSSFNLAEPQIHMAQILVTPGPDQNVRNLKNDNAQTEAEARKKIENLYARVKQGEDFSQIAQNYSEDPDYAQAGGDLGFLTESSLEKANADLRRMVMSLRAGETTNIIKTAEGYRILKVISREPAGQRELTDPKVQQTIRETLLNRKDQLLKAAYFEVARNEAKVENYFAQSVMGDPSKKK